MKSLLKIALLSMICINFQCRKSIDTTTKKAPNAKNLEEKKQTILNYINSFQCTTGNGCSSIAIGVKPCGGPWEYLFYSNNVNVTQLQEMVSEYNAMNLEFNSATNAISDCMIVSPPTNIGCVNGKCSIIQ